MLSSYLVIYLVYDLSVESVGGSKKKANHAMLGPFFKTESKILLQVPVPIRTVSRNYFFGLISMAHDT